MGTTVWLKEKSKTNHLENRENKDRVKRSQDTPTLPAWQHLGVFTSASLETVLFPWQSCNKCSWDFCALLYRSPISIFLITGICMEHIILQCVFPYPLPYCWTCYFPLYATVIGTQQTCWEKWKETEFLVSPSAVVTEFVTPEERP